MKVADFITEMKRRNPTTRAGFCAILGPGEFRGRVTPEEAYEVVSRAKTLVVDGARQEAMLYLNHMRGHGQSPHFTKLDVNLVACQLALRVLEPWRFNQGGFRLCGPAAFAMMMAQSRPNELMRFAYDLLYKGKGTIAGWEIAPGERIKTYDPTAKLPDADWLLMASLRNQTMAQSQEGGNYGGSTINDMHKWLKDAGYQTICSMPTVKAFPDRGAVGRIVSAVRSLGVAFIPEFTPSRPAFLSALNTAAGMDAVTNLKWVDRFLRNGWTVFLITSEGMTKAGISGDAKARRFVDEKKDSGFELPSGLSWEDFQFKRGQDPSESKGDPDHWVLLQKFYFKERAQKVSFKGYSWGEVSSVAGLDLAEFVADYGGFVAADSRDIKAVEQSWISYLY